MPPLLEYCLDNVDRSARERLQSLDVPVRERQCLQRCGRCYRSPFVVIDGDPVCVPNHSSLPDDVAPTRGDDE